MNTEPRASGLVSLRCQHCKRPMSLMLPLMTLPDGTMLCQDCHQRRQSSRGELPPVEQKEPTDDRRKAPLGSYYEIAGVSQDASTEEIMAAIKARMKHWLMRQSGDEGSKAAEMLAKLRAASEDLTDPERRKRYDAKLHQHMQSQRADIIKRTITPLEDLPGRQVTSLKDLITACEASATTWRTCEGLLEKKRLVLWVRWSLADDETVRLIERVVARQDLSLFRKLNELFYQFDPERPFRFFSDPDTFEAVSKQKSVTDIETLITFADAHWNLAVQHLYRGELITWLDQSVSPTGRYLGQTYHNARQFFKEVCSPFANTNLEGVGLEALLEFLDPSISKPAPVILFDTQEAAYTLLDWDEELPHQPVALSIKNTTRGYFAGTLELHPPEKQHATSATWVDYNYLPLAPPLYPQPTLTTQSFTLQGNQEQRFNLYLGHFKGLARGRIHERCIELRRYIRQPSQPTTVRQFPIHLSLMRFRAGYRGKLWAYGLRGGLPGMLLDGGLGFGIGLLLFWLGVLFTPNDSWGFFQNFSGNFSWLMVLDGALVALLRPFFLSIAVFGFGLASTLGIAFAICGFFTGWRRGHTAVTKEQDKHTHQVFCRWLMLGLWAAAGGVIALLAHTPTYPALFDVSFLGFARSIQVTAFFIPSLGFSPLHSLYFVTLAILMPGIFANIAMRRVIAVRSRLYDKTEKNWGKLKQPAGRG